MTTPIRPELSQKNRYWISKHRYYELKHFCLQYPDWKKNYRSLDATASNRPAVIQHEDGAISKPTEVYAEARLFFSTRMAMVEQTAMKAAGDLAPLMLKSVTEGISYEKLRAREGVPCCKDVWYAAYRRFFWLLDKARE